MCELNYHNIKLLSEVAAFIGAVIGSQDLMEIGSKKEDGDMSIAAVEKWEAKQREIGRQAGIQEGRQAGIQEGRQIGLQEGIQEGRQLIILNMLRDDIPMDVIVRLTGVSEEKIEAIRKEMDNASEK